MDWPWSSRSRLKRLEQQNQRLEREQARAEQERDEMWDILQRQDAVLVSSGLIEPGAAAGLPKALAAAVASGHAGPVCLDDCGQKVIVILGDAAGLLAAPGLWQDIRRAVAGLRHAGTDGVMELPVGLDAVALRARDGRPVIAVSGDLSRVQRRNAIREARRCARRHGWAGAPGRAAGRPAALMSATVGISVTAALLLAAAGRPAVVIREESRGEIPITIVTKPAHMARRQDVRPQTDPDWAQDLAQARALPDPGAAAARAGRPARGHGGCRSLPVSAHAPVTPRVSRPCHAGHRPLPQTA